MLWLDIRIHLTFSFGLHLHNTQRQLFYIFKNEDHTHLSNFHSFLCSVKFYQNGSRQTH